MKRINNSKRQLGQGMTEYIIIVALVAIGAFGVYNLFGKTVRQEVASAAMGLAGQGQTAVNEAKDATATSNTAEAQANTAQSTSNAAANTGLE